MELREKLANQIAEGKFIGYEREAVRRLARGLPVTERFEDLDQEVRLHALIASHKFDPARGAGFASFLRTYLGSRVKDHLAAFYRESRNPNSVAPLEFDIPHQQKDATLELEEFRARLTPSTRSLLDSAAKENSPALRRKILAGRAGAALRNLSGLNKAQLRGALEEIRREGEACLCSA